MKHKLLYIMDPLCGWCFGFSPVVLKLRDEYKDVFDVNVIPGGMMIGTRVGPASNMASYILTAYQRVEDMAGVKFGEPYLDMLRDGTEMLDSEPPCRAIHTFQQAHPYQALDFAHELQLKQFQEGKSFNDLNTYRELATQFSTDADHLVNQMETEEARYGTRGDFQWVQSAGITGFPLPGAAKR
ncbi:DsbA family protein [Polluticoccus soli]|uniref:DsbA family protein n=1 Tax=Polluticoccus soli TaxID=3034150 RepID=UPI0023E2859C|nr:DsbA family protein [Flavipsychrobacter sp. JY13-12]